MISPAYRQRAARALFGSSRSELIPAVLWLGLLSTTGVALAVPRVRLPNTDAVFGASGDGVANVAPIDAGSTPSAMIVGRVGLWTAAAGGTLIISASLPSPITTSADEALTIPVAALTLVVA